VLEPVHLPASNHDGEREPKPHETGNEIGEGGWLLVVHAGAPDEKGRPGNPGRRVA
jgi:hypothetical protein